MKNIKGLKIIVIGLVVLVFGLGLWADGFIVIPHPGDVLPPRHPHPRPRPHPVFQPFPLEVVYHHVDVQINEQMAVTSVDQEFFNPTRHRLEGYYLFPLPKNAVINKFSMYIDGKETTAELLDAKKARHIYEDIVRRQRDPALLEYSDRGVFKARIFPIEPHSRKRVKISYRQILPKDNNTVEYVYPLNTEKFSAKPLKDVSINVNLTANENIKTIYCPSHEVEIRHKNKHLAVVGFEQKNTKPDTDFQLYFTTDNSELGLSLLSYKKARDDGYFFLSLSPGIADSQDRNSEKDIIFVMDASGSMAGPKMKQAKKALLFCVENLNQGDRFEIIRFSTEAEALFNGFKDASENNRREAGDFIDGLRPIGGTNMDEALSMALNMKTRKGRPCMVVFMTDGKPTIGETDETHLLSKIKNTNTSNFRIFTFGIGNEINTHLLDKITEMTRAHRTYISEEEDIEVKVSNFYEKVQSPVLSDISLNVEGGVTISKTYPRNLPDVFKGSAINVLGRYRGAGDGYVILKGFMKGEEKTYRFKIPRGFVDAADRQALENDFIPPLWAARRVGYLLDQVRLHGEDKELIDEITQLARTYGILTPYTSYLIVEDERLRVTQRHLRRDYRTLSPMAEQDGGFDAANAESYSRMKKMKSGPAGVRFSKEIQSLNMADNFSQKSQGEARLNFKDREGNQRNLLQQVKNIQGFAFYNVNNVWVDSRVQSQKPSQNRMNTRRIQFASKDYFQLLKDEPQSAQFLALGQNVNFVLNNTVYEIYE